MDNNGKFEKSKVHPREDRKPFVPRCEFWKCKRSDLGHWINGCVESTHAEKGKTTADIAATKSRDDPANNARVLNEDSLNNNFERKAGGVNRGAFDNPPASWKIFIIDGNSEF